MGERFTLRRPGVRMGVAEGVADMVDAYALGKREAACSFDLDLGVVNSAVSLRAPPLRDSTQSRVSYVLRPYTV